MNLSRPELQAQTATDLAKERSNKQAIFITTLLASCGLAYLAWPESED